MVQLVGVSFHPLSGCLQETTDSCFSYTLMFLSLSLKKNKKQQQTNPEEEERGGREGGEVGGGGGEIMREKRHVEENTGHLSRNGEFIVVLIRLCSS